MQDAPVTQAKHNVHTSTRCELSLNVLRVIIRYKIILLRLNTLDLWWQERTGKTKGAVEEINGAGDENIRMELGPSDEVGSGQKTVVFFGWIK